MNGNTRICGVMGHPVGHSLSPSLHNLLAERTGLNLVYVPFDVKPEDLEAGVKGSLGLNVLGLNVTVPHKQQVMQYLAGTDQASQVIGAVNTLVRTEKGYVGRNTDAPGFSRALKEAGVQVKGSRCVLLGAGGAARAAAWVLASEGAEKVWILNRTIDRARELADHVNQAAGRFVMIPLALEDYRQLPEEKNSLLAIQSTSVGMYPDGDRAVIEDSDFYERIRVGMDIVYTPSQTRFMTLVQQAGGQAFNGLNMLIYQGVIAFEMWNPGVKVDQETIQAARELLEAKLAKTNLILIGFMGAGKTSVAEYCGRRYGMEVVDTDQRIEEMAGMPISQIFATQGEDAFRRLETRMLEELQKEPGGRVISVGGGLPLRRENQELLKKLGQVVCLDVTVDTVLERLGGDVSSRPMLQGGDVRARAQELMDQRRDVYIRVSDRVVDVNNRPVWAIAGEIYGFLNPQEKRA